MILGIIDGQEGLHADAIDKLTAAIGDSDHWLIRFYLGRAYLAAGSAVEAIDEFELLTQRRGEASSLFLDDLPTWRYLATLPYWQGRAHDEMGMAAAAPVQLVDEPVVSHRTLEDGVILLDFGKVAFGNLRAD